MYRERERWMWRRLISKSLMKWIRKLIPKTVTHTEVSDYLSLKRKNWSSDAVDRRRTSAIRIMNIDRVIYMCSVLLGCPTSSSEDLKLYLWTFFSFFYQSTVLSSRAVNGHQMYFGVSVVGKTSTTGIAISPTRPLIFTGGGSKCVKFGVVFNVTQFWAAHVWKCSKISKRWNKFLV